jgi:hypothetical protein
LGHSVVSSVANAVSEPIPELPQEPEDGSKRPSSVKRQNARDVFPNEPTGQKSLSKAYKLKREIPALASNARSKSRDAEILAGGAADKKVN